MGPGFFVTKSSSPVLPTMSRTGDLRPAQLAQTEPVCKSHGTETDNTSDATQSGASQWTHIGHKKDEMTSTHTLFTAATLIVAAASPAFAHVLPDAHGAFLAGATHPVFGLDHVLAMLVVGVWALQIGGRALWALPAAFVGAMIMGYLAAGTGLPLPMVEPMILASSIFIGLVVSLALSPGLWAAALITALFGLFHGHAHGMELGTASALPFGLGFMLATSLLHGVGIVLGLLLARAHPMAPRALGALSALTGLSLAL